MKNFIIKKLDGINRYYLIGSVLLLLFGCGSSNDTINTSSSDTGSILFNIVWDDGLSKSRDEASVHLAVAPSGDVCEDYSIDTIDSKVYNASNVEVKSASWACSSHQGTITSVTAGSGMRLILEGIVSGSVAWRGEKTGLTVLKGQSTNAGPVTVEYIGNNTTPPSIDQTFPVNSEVDVPVDSIIIVLFYEPVVDASVNASTFTLYNGSTQISGEVVYDSTNYAAGFIPDNYLLPGETYTASITTGVQSLSGVQMTGDYSWSFTSEVSITPFALPDTGQTDFYGTCCGEDADYDINPPAFTDNSDGTVTDLNTGMMWQQSDDNVTRNWADSSIYCEDLSLAGYTDWRLPMFMELFTILDYSGPSPAIDSAVFPGTDDTGISYWTTTDPAQSISTDALPLNFTGSGYSYITDKSSLKYVRCVRGRTFPDAVLFDNGDSTITDNGTGLMWQELEGTSGTWQASIDYCESLVLAGHSDWRLPNIKELATLLDFSQTIGPAINTNYFCNCVSGFYWSSTAYFNLVDSGAVIDFTANATNTLWAESMTNSHSVRCVRN